MGGRPLDPRDDMWIPLGVSLPERIKLTHGHWRGSPFDPGFGFNDWLWNVAIARHLVAGRPPLFRIRCEELARLCVQDRDTGRPDPDGIAGERPAHETWIEIDKYAALGRTGPPGAGIAVVRPGVIPDPRPFSSPDLPLGAFPIAGFEEGYRGYRQGHEWLPFHLLTNEEEHQCRIWEPATGAAEARDRLHARRPIPPLGKLHPDKRPGKRNREG